MKIIAKSLLLSLSLFAAQSFAAPAYKASLIDDNAPKTTANTYTYQVAIFPAASVNVLNVMVQKPATKTLLIRVTDGKGSELAQEYVSKKAGSYQVKFNMEQLTDGQYKIEVTNGKTTTSYPFTLSTKEPAITSRTISLL